MKLVGIGLEESVPGVVSYLDSVKIAPGQAAPKTTMADFDGTCNVHQFMGGSLPGGAVAAMIVRNTGKPCPIRNFYSQNLLVPGLEIVRRARNGEANVTGDGFVAYTPKPGFAGRDYFAYRSTARQFAVAANVVVLPVK